VVVGPFESAGAAGVAGRRIAGQCGRARTSKRITTPGNWMTYGRTYTNKRFSPLSANFSRQREAARPWAPRAIKRPGGREGAPQAGGVCGQPDPGIPPGLCGDPTRGIPPCAPVMAPMHRSLGAALHGQHGEYIERQLGASPKACA